MKPFLLCLLSGGK